MRLFLQGSVDYHFIKHCLVIEGYQGLSPKHAGIAKGPVWAWAGTMVQRTERPHSAQWSWVAKPSFFRGPYLISTCIDLCRRDCICRSRHRSEGHQGGSSSSKTTHRVSHLMRVSFSAGCWETATFRNPKRFHGIINQAGRVCQDWNEFSFTSNSFLELTHVNPALPPHTHTHTHAENPSESDFKMNTLNCIYVCSWTW